MSDDSMIEEFKVEASEMFESAEEALLNLDKGQDFTTNFNSIFRSFHSLKGAAGMFGLEELQEHMHKLETLFEAQKSNGKMEKIKVDYFLEGIDCAKQLLDGKNFNFTHLENFNVNNNSQETKKVEIPKTAEKSSSLSLEIPENTKLNNRDRPVVFIIDDEPDIVLLLEMILEDQNYLIHKFYDGIEALESIDILNPDIILTDISMPKMGGLDLLKSVYEMKLTTPVVFISGNISKDKMMEALNFGVYAFIDKPFEEVNVKNICSSAIKKSKAMSLIEKSINYILYQYSDLDAYLKAQGKESVRIALKTELEIILEQRKILKSL